MSAGLQNVYSSWGPIYISRGYFRFRPFILGRLRNMMPTTERIRKLQLLTVQICLAMDAISLGVQH